ncbi:MAG: DUF3435 domain-containing protein [Thermomicrobium sp.]|nr:DUF3435 domain-containing protein [Thermomicrobium sp.]
MQPTIAGAIERFLDDLRLSPRSRSTYRIAVAKFLRHLTEVQGLDPESPLETLREDHAVAFLRDLVPEDIKTPEQVSRMRTAQTTFAAVRKFYAYLVSFDLHPALSTEKLKVRAAAVLPRFTPPPTDVRTEELERIVEYVRALPPEADPTRELRRLKIRALILFLFRTGVRVSELCALRRQDIDLDSGTARIYRAKGGKSRTVHFDSETAEALAAYWRARGDAGRGVGLYPAFSGRDRPGQPGRAISPRTVQALVSRLGEEAGVEYPVTPHSFRHGLATELVRRRVRESTVQAILGHASPVTTRIYVHLTAQEAAEEYHAAFGPYRRPGQGRRAGAP